MKQVNPNVGTLLGVAILLSAPAGILMEKFVTGGELKNFIASMVIYGVIAGSIIFREKMKFS